MLKLFFVHLRHDTAGNYVWRVYGNIYTIFFVFDEDKIVVLFNGFQKKTQKTPVREITKALKIKAMYYEYKKRNGSGL